MMTVTMGKADACFAYEPCLAAIDTTTGKIRWKSQKTIMALSLKDDPDGLFPIVGVVLKNGRNPDGAEAFLRFLQSDDVKKIYSKWAFDSIPQK
jgi:ABC-type molybdate transport system substrate-binding protein